MEPGYKISTNNSLSKFSKLNTEYYEKELKRNLKYSERYKDLINAFLKLVHYTNEEFDRIEIRNALLELPDLIQPLNEDSLSVPSEIIFFLLELFKTQFPNPESITITNQLLIIFNRIIISNLNTVDILLQHDFLPILMNCYPFLTTQVSLGSYIQLLYTLIHLEDENILNFFAPQFIISLGNRIDTSGPCKFWLDCLDEISKKHHPPEAVQELLNLFSNLSNKFRHESSFLAKVCWILSHLIQNNEINLQQFEELSFPHKLIEFYQSDDHRLISASVATIGYLYLKYGYKISEFNIVLLCNVCTEYKTQKVFRSSFWTYSLYVENDTKYIVDIFESNCLEFFNIYFDVSYELKKEIAIFIATILKFSTQNELQMILNSCFLQIVYESLSFENINFVEVALEGLINIGKMVQELSIVEDFVNTISNYISEDIIDGICEINDNKNIINLVGIIENEYPFVFGICK